MADDKGKTKYGLSDSDYKDLQTYLQEMDKLTNQEPVMMTGEDWDDAWPRIQANGGVVPEEYKGRIGCRVAVNEDTKENEYSYYDIVWNEWVKKTTELNKKYRDPIIKALHHVIANGIILDTAKGENESIVELLEALVANRETESPQRVIELLPQLTSIIPHTHVIPNNKLANSLTREPLDGQMLELTVSQRGKNEITTRCILSYEGENVKLSSRQPFTEYDRQVADAVTSLFIYGDESHMITPATVYRAMVHATATETPSAQQIGAVTRSLDKMRFVRVQIDCSEELKQRKISLDGAQITGGKIDTYLLALEKKEVLAGGKKVVAYKIIKTPILYEYSQLIKQVITLPAELLDIRDIHGQKVPNTERRIAIKGYLMRRISVMKGKSGSKQSRHILYSDLFDNICYGEPSPKEQRLIREYVGIVLKCWAHVKFINGYNEFSQGRKKLGVNIVLH